MLRREPPIESYRFLSTAARDQWLCPCPMAQPELPLVSFARRLKQLRVGRGLAVRELAAELHLHVSSIYNIERGVHGFSINRLPELARALRVDELDLFTFPEESERQALVDLSRDVPIKALRAAEELLRNGPLAPMPIT
jgi:transcriptional regulator with XRE-family HTH domain